VVPDAVPAAHCAALLGEMWPFLRMPRGLAAPEDWYNCAWPADTHRPSGWVHMRQTQGCWDNRQAERVHRAFAELIGTPRLWVSQGSRPGPFGLSERPLRSPYWLDCLWCFCMGAQGA
jgi:hypothetical protein